jgi:hypothetical protein
MNLFVVMISKHLSTHSLSKHWTKQTGRRKEQNALYVEISCAKVRLDILTISGLVENILREIPAHCLKKIVNKNSPHDGWMAGLWKGHTEMTIVQRCQCTVSPWASVSGSNIQGRGKMGRRSHESQSICAWMTMTLPGSSWESNVYKKWNWVQRGAVLDAWSKCWNYLWNVVDTIWDGSPLLSLYGIKRQMKHTPKSNSLLLGMFYRLLFFPHLFCSGTVVFTERCLLAKLNLILSFFG